jgi:hypothetical protein
MIKFFQNKEELSVVKIIFERDNTTFHYVKVYRDSQVLEIDNESFCITDSIKELKTYVKKQPVILLFSGDKILYSDNNELFKSSEKDFYSTCYNTIENKKFLALIRKGQVDSIVNDFIVNDFFILNISVGVLAFNLLYKDNLTKNEEIIDGVSLGFEKGVFFQAKSLIDEFVGLNELTSNSEVLILSLVFNFFYPSNDIVNNYENEFIEKNREELKHKTSLGFIVKMGGLFLLVIIVLGYFLGIFFTNKNTEIKNQLNLGINKERMLEELLKIEHRKKGMLQLSGFYKTNISSFYINEIIRVLPNEIRLSRLNVFPINKNTEENKKIIIKEKLIIIEGRFTSVVDFNIWITKLRSVLDVVTLDITKYKKPKSFTNFEIHVFLK